MSDDEVESIQIVHRPEGTVTQQFLGTKPYVLLELDPKTEEFSIHSGGLTLTAAEIPEFISDYLSLARIYVEEGEINE